jgi:hypothetical protein
MCGLRKKCGVGVPKSSDSRVVERGPPANVALNPITVIFVVEQLAAFLALYCCVTVTAVSGFHINVTVLGEFVEVLIAGLVYLAIVEVHSST